MKKIFLFLISFFISNLFSFISYGKSNEQDSIFIEAENYDEAIGLIRLEAKPNASGGYCVHIGPDSNIESEGIGSAVIFNFSIENDFCMGVFEVRYSDDVQGNIIHVYLDNVKKGCFKTENYGGWNDFEWDNQKINLGHINNGLHTIKLEMSKGGSWGVNLDCYKITNVEPVDEVTGAYDYIKSLINTSTGLVNGADYDDNFTTVYKNALAAMAFIHENDTALAEGIFNFFKSVLDTTNDFNGFNKNWDPATGNELAKDYWEGDNAFLLLALNYYNKVTGSFGDYKTMVDSIVKWLPERVDSVEIAEGFANMFAALKPFEDSVHGMDDILDTLESKFYETVDFQEVLDHTERAALCFSDDSGFTYIDTFKRTETWKYNDTVINALAAFSGEEFINVEISAQMLLAWEIRKLYLTTDLSYLEDELEKLWLLSESAPEIIAYGLPYYLDERGWPSSWDESIIDPPCYMLFYYWHFNPMANFPKTCQINASVNINEGGGVSGYGLYNLGDTVIVTAIQNEGYEFVNWTQNDSIIDTNTTYTFVATEDRNLVANFTLVDKIFNNYDKINIKIHPNPVNNVLNIIGLDRNSTLTIYSISGKHIKQLNINSNIKSVDISDLSKGIFIIKLVNDRYIITKKLIKQ